jgi:hypothetical protein
MMLVKNSYNFGGNLHHFVSILGEGLKAMNNMKSTCPKGRTKSDLGANTINSRRGINKNKVYDRPAIFLESANKQKQQNSLHKDKNNSKGKVYC